MVEHSIRIADVACFGHVSGTCTEAASHIAQIVRCLENISRPSIYDYFQGGYALFCVIYNEALRLLDALAQLSALDRSRTTLPASPTGGVPPIVASGRPACGRASI
nr:DUF2793 domain-containing protein [Pseudorhodobacter wandonensis]